MIGVVGEPVWTSIGATLWYAEPIEKPVLNGVEVAVPIQLNAVWFNWLLAQGHKFTAMNQVGKALRDKAKARIAAMADSLSGTILHTAVTDDNRIITHTEHGNLFGYVKRGQELRAAASKSWKIIHAVETDGNILAVLV